MELSGTGRDAKDFRRGAYTNALGTVARGAHPALLFLVTNLYGASNWGVFVLCQAAMYILGRTAMGGMDRTLLYWIPQKSEKSALKGVPELRAARNRTLVFTILAGAIMVCSPRWFAWVNPSGASTIGPLFRGHRGAVTWVAATMPLYGLMEFHIHSLVSLRDLRVQVFVRDLLVPLTHIVLCALTYPLGWGTTALGFAFFVAHLLAVAVTSRVFAKHFGGVPGNGAPSWRLPTTFSRYARPMWIADLAATGLQRVDTVVVGWFGGAALAGVYDVVRQFANTVIGFRGNYESLVVAVVAGISRAHDPNRLAQGFSRASSLVLMLQVPTLALFYLFGRSLLGLAGDGFEIGYPALWVFCTALVYVACMGLSGQVVSGYGGARSARFATSVALAVQLGLLLLCVPQWGIIGGAVATGSALLVQSVIQLVQMRLATGAWNYTRKLATLCMATIVLMATVAWWTHGS